MKLRTKDEQYEKTMDRIRFIFVDLFICIYYYSSLNWYTKSLNQS